MKKDVLGRLADILAPQSAVEGGPGGLPMNICKAVVVAVNGTLLDIDRGFGTIEGVAKLKSYTTAAVNDDVWVITFGDDMLVIGETG